VYLALFQPFYHRSAKNYQNCWTCDEVLTKTILHRFFETRCIADCSGTGMSLKWWAASHCILGC